MPTVRTTFRPDLTVEVDDTEYRSLKKQGLLVEDEPQAEEPRTDASTAPATKKTVADSGTPRSKES
jgi:hypothetical protein